MTIYHLTEGWTDPIDCIIKADGVALPLTGLTVTIYGWNANRVSIPMPGTVSIVSAIDGRVRYSPTGTELLASRSPIRIRWRIADGSGKWREVPNAPQTDKWIVSRP